MVVPPLGLLGAIYSAFLICQTTTQVIFNVDGIDGADRRLDALACEGRWEHARRGAIEISPSAAATRGDGVGDRKLGGEHGCMAQISSLGAGGLPVLGFGKANLPVPPSNDGV